MAGPTALPCALATKAHTVVITLLSVSRGVETLHGVQRKAVILNNITVQY